jgi:hypothetical protein
LNIPPSVFLFFLLVLSACGSTQTDGSADQTTADAMPAPAERHVAKENRAVEDNTASLAEVAHVTCKPDNSGSSTCTSGNLDVELTGNCGRGGFFGAVVEEGGVALEDNPANPAASSLARLGKGQFVCIQGIARNGQNPERYFVKAIPVSSVAECKGNTLCEMYGDRDVEWILRPTGRACSASGAGTYVGDCAAGWVGVTSIEAFSEGL